MPKFPRNKLARKVGSCKLSYLRIKSLYFSTKVKKIEKTNPVYQLKVRTSEMSVTNEVCHDLEGGSNKRSALGIYKM